MIAVAAFILLGVLLGLVVLLAFADSFALLIAGHRRLMWPSKVAWITERKPVIVHSEAIMKVVPGSNRAAVTLGHTIVVGDWGYNEYLQDTFTWQNLIRHEQMHVHQREREGRPWIFLYIFTFIMHGYDNKYEREANLAELNAQR